MPAPPEFAWAAATAADGSPINIMIIIIIIIIISSSSSSCGSTTSNIIIRMIITIMITVTGCGNGLLGMPKTSLPAVRIYVCYIIMFHRYVRMGV